MCVKLSNLKPFLSNIASNTALVLKSIWYTGQKKFYSKGELWITRKKHNANINQ